MLVSTVDRSPNNEESVVMGGIQNMSSDFCECFPIYRRIIIFLDALKVNAVDCSSPPHCAFVIVDDL